MTSTAVRPALLPPHLNPGDRVRLVSPASTPDRGLVQNGVDLLTSWGLQVEAGKHAFDSLGYLAGADEDRLADLNDAFRDPGVRAVFATRGGKGAYRIADALDFDAVRRDPKPVIGFSDITALHLALWKQAGVVGIHGPSMSWYEPNCGPECAEALRRALMTTDEIVVRQDPKELSAALTEGEPATGFLMGGNLDTLRGAAGADLPSFDGGVLLIEVNHGTGLGMVDRQLTQLIRSGQLDESVEVERQGVTWAHTLDAERPGQKGIVRARPGTDPGPPTRLKTRGILKIVTVQIDGRHDDGVHHGTSSWSSGRRGSSRR